MVVSNTLLGKLSGVPIALIPLLLLIAAQGKWWTLFAFAAILVILLVARRFLADTRFYLTWTWVSAVWCIAIIQFIVVPFLEIRIDENFLLIAMVIGALLCFYLVKIDPPKMEDKSHGGESLNAYLADKAVAQCAACNTFAADRLHHCAWLNCCITSRNHIRYKWGMALTIGATAYGSNLIYTTLCYPINFFDNALLVLYNCEDAYHSLHTSIGFITGVYMTAITIFTVLSFIHHLVMMYLPRFKLTRARGFGTGISAQSPVYGRATCN